MLVALMRLRAGAFGPSRRRLHSRACTIWGLCQPSCGCGEVGGQPQGSAAKDLGDPSPATSSGNIGNPAKVWGNIQSPPSRLDGSAKAGKAEKAEKPASIGDPLAPGKMELLREEILSRHPKRGTVDICSFPELCHWPPRCVGRPLHRLGVGGQLPPELVRPPDAEHAGRPGRGRAVHARIAHWRSATSTTGWPRCWRSRRQRWMSASGSRASSPPPTSPEQALEVIKQALTEAQVAYCAALAPLEQVGDPRVADVSGARALHAEPRGAYAGRPRHGPAAVRPDGEDGPRRPATRPPRPWPRRRRATAGTTQVAAGRRATCRVAGRDGHGRRRGSTRPAARSSSAARGRNTYQLDQMRDVAVVIDLGGDDTYYEGTVGLDRPVLVVIDLGGNNTFRGSKPGIQGGAVLGVSMLAEPRRRQHLRGPGRGPRFGPGRRRHPRSTTAATTATAACAACKARPSAAWASSSTAAARTTITPPCGPKASAARWASACWTTSTGNNHYYCGGMWRNSYYPETPGYEGWGQGVGAGIRQVADGGIGVILDGGGDERLRVRLPLPRRRLLVRAGLRPRFRRQHQAADHPQRPTTAARARSPASSASAAAGAATTRWASASTTAATTSTKARSWAPAWPGTARWACSATSPATTTTRPPAA